MADPSPAKKSSDLLNLDIPYVKPPKMPDYILVVTINDQTLSLPAHLSDTEIERRIQEFAKEALKEARTQEYLNQPLRVHPTTNITKVFP